MISVSDRLEQQLDFIVELDKLKHVLRYTHLLNEHRRENSAEHSWHLAMLAIVLTEYANEPVDLLRVLKMLLIHDIVEIDAGDTFLFDADGNQDKAVREMRAAARIFGLLPADQRDEFHALWREFEARTTPDARFASALDRFMPLLHNYLSDGQASWRPNHITETQVMAFNHILREGAEPLGAYAQALVEDSVTQGFLAAEDGTSF